MIKIQVYKLEDDIIKVVLPFTHITINIIVYPKRPDKLTSIVICPAKFINIEESSILLQVLDYLFYKIANNLDIANEIVIDELVLPKNTVSQKFDKRELLVVLYAHDKEDEKMFWCGSLLVRNEFGIRLFFNNGITTNLRNLLDIEIKFNEPLSRSESFDLAYFVTFVIYRICNGSYNEHNDIRIYSNGRYFDEEKIELFVKGCKKCYGDTDFRYNQGITPIGDCYDNWFDES